MNRFELPQELDEQQAHRLRLATVVATNNNWEDMNERGWEVSDSPLGIGDYCLDTMMPRLTWYANHEASRRASIEGVYIPVPEDSARDCGRVALARLSDVYSWHSRGYVKAKHPKLLTIGNAEIFGDTEFIGKIPKAESELRKVGQLLIGDNFLSPGRRLYPEYNELLEITGRFLGHIIETLDLESEAERIHIAIQERRKAYEEMISQREKEERRPRNVISRFFDRLKTPQTVS